MFLKGKEGSLTFLVIGESDGFVIINGIFFLCVCNFFRLMCVKIGGRRGREIERDEGNGEEGKGEGEGKGRDERKRWKDKQELEEEGEE